MTGLVLFTAGAPMCLARAVTTPAELQANADIEPTSVHSQATCFAQGPDRARKSKKYGEHGGSPP